MSYHPRPSQAKSWLMLLLISLWPNLLLSMLHISLLMTSQEHFMSKFTNYSSKKIKDNTSRVVKYHISVLVLYLYPHHSQHNAKWADKTSCDIKPSSNLPKIRIYCRWKSKLDCTQKNEKRKTKSKPILI